MRYFVYELHCPVALEVRYVGFSSSPDSRLASHVQPSSNTACKEWVFDLATTNRMKPGLKIVFESTNRASAFKYEKELIKYYRSKGAALLNKIGFSEKTDHRKKVIKVDEEIYNQVKIYCDLHGLKIGKFYDLSVTDRLEKEKEKAKTKKK